MDVSLKQRLVGATVLVAIGVIFIPILLERGREESRLTVSMEIPAKPDVNFKKRLENPDLPNIEALPPMEESVAAVKQTFEKELPTPTSNVSEDTPSAVPIVKTEKPQASVKSDKAVAVPESKTVENKVEVAEKWIVQVGSFSRNENAKSLSDKLNNMGFKAFVALAKTDAGSVYRVRVGPLEKREAAESIVKKLSAKGDYRGIVMRFPEIN